MERQYNYNKEAEAGEGDDENNNNNPNNTTMLTTTMTTTSKMLMLKMMSMMVILTDFKFRTNTSNLFKKRIRRDEKLPNT